MRIFRIILGDKNEMLLNNQSDEKKKAATTHKILPQALTEALLSLRMHAAK